MILTKSHKLFTPLVKRKPRALVLFDQENKVSAHIPLSHFIAPHVFETRTGALGFIVKVKGLPFETADAQTLNEAQRQWAFTLKNLGTDFAVAQTIYRRRALSQLKGDYSEGFAKDFHAGYQQTFQASPLFVNDIYLSFILKSVNPLEGRLKFLTHLTQKTLAKSRTERTQIKEKQWDKLTAAIDQLKLSLKIYQPVLLGMKAHYSEILSFFSVLVNGEAKDLLLPSANIASYLPSKRLFFGKNAVHFEGLTDAHAHKDDKSRAAQNHQFGAVLSIKNYSPYTQPGHLNALLSLPFGYIQTQTYQGIAKGEALEQIRRQQVKLLSVNDQSQSQIAELDQAADDVASDRINFGRHHSTLLVLSDNLPDLEEQSAQAAALYAHQGISVVRETLNLENAFWAQMPGNSAYIRRQSLISCQNFTGFCALHNFSTGYAGQNHLGGAVMLTETKSRTPFYFNLHEKASGRKEDLPKGHTTMIGASNAGKTVILLSVNAMMQKYGLRSFIFDRNRGCEIYVRAMGGDYYLIDGHKPTGFNPCQLQDTPSNRAFLRALLLQLTARPDAPLTANDENHIANAVDRNFTLTFANRNLSSLSAFLPIDFKGLPALQPWLRAPDRTGKTGEYAWVFDNARETLDLESTLMGFDMTAILGSEANGNQYADILTPVMMYLFKRIELAMKGRLTGIFLDEGWQFCRHPYWIAKLKEYAAVIRKENGFLFFATQLPESLAQSPLASSLIQGAATQIFLANPKAQAQDYRGVFKLTAKEFEFIKTANPVDRYFLFKQGHESAVMRINFKGMEKYLSILSANKLTLQLLNSLTTDKMQQTDQILAPSQWLPEFYASMRDLQ